MEASLYLIYFSIGAFLIFKKVSLALLRTNLCHKHILLMAKVSMFAFALSLSMPAIFAQSNVRVESAPSATLVKNVIWTTNPDSSVNALLEHAKRNLVGLHLDDAQLTRTENMLTGELRAQGYLIGQIVASSVDRTRFYRTGDLRFSVFLGKIGQIVVKNASPVDSEWVNSVVTNTLCPDGVGDDCVLTKAKFERMTQLLQDTVGLQTGSLDFSADGMPIGQTKLTVATVAKDGRIKGSVGIDNQGFSSTGVYRLGASVSANNLFEVGDVLALNVYSSSKDAFTGALDVSGPLSTNGLRWQSSLSRSQSFLPSVNSNGFGNSASIGVAYPLVRGLDENWTVGLNAVGVVTNSETLGVTTTNKTLESGQLVLDGNSGDRSIALGQNSWYAHSALTMGQVNDSAAMPGSDQLLGAYTKLAFQGVGKAILNDKHSVFTVLNIRGQVANVNLDPYEKLLIGGFSGVRAYSPQQGSFNQGTIVTAELRQAINTEWGQFIPVVFMDYANGWLNQATYPGWQVSNGYSNPNISNHMVLSDAGLGLDWNGFHGFTVSASWARRLPFSPVGLNNTGNANSQFWFLVQSRF